MRLVRPAKSAGNGSSMELFGALTKVAHRLLTRAANLAESFFVRGNLDRLSVQRHNLFRHAGGPLQMATTRATTGERYAPRFRCV